MQLRLVPALALVAACAQYVPPHEPPDLVAATARALRPDARDPDDLYHYDATDEVLHLDTPEGHFRLYFTTAGAHRVKAGDADADGVPDFVESAAEAYERAWAHYHQVLGFREPLLAPDEDRFSVYLLDFNGMGDGAYREEACDGDTPDQCRGFMVQENDYAGYGYPSTRDANLILASHEYFHAVQAAYDAHLGTIPNEGTAVWATEHFEGRLRDFEGFLEGFLDNPSRSLDEPLPGPVDPFSYGSALWFRFLEERFGAEVVRELFEHAVDGVDGLADPTWLDALQAALALHDTSFAEAYREFTEWNLRTGTWADPVSSYTYGASYPAVRVETAVLPLEEDRLRVFHASAQYTSVAVEGRSLLTAALLAPEDGNLDGLSLSIAVRGAAKETRIVRLDDPTAGTQLVELDGASTAIVMVVNTLLGGPSQRPALCVGSAEEVATCRATLRPAPPAPVEPEPPPLDEGGGGDDGGCAHTTRDVWALAALAFVVSARRRGAGARG